MRQLALIVLVCLTVSCQEKKYDPQTYGKAVDAGTGDSHEEAPRMHRLLKNDHFFCWRNDSFREEYKYKGISAHINMDTPKA